VSAPALSGVVIHWRDEEHLAELIAAWPRDPRFELVVVDNGSSRELPDLPEGIAGRLLRPLGNLGFAGAANRGAARSHGPVILLLNPDAVPEPGALDALLDGFAAHPLAAGLAPRLEEASDEEGRRSQHGWQLGRLPSPLRLVLESLFLPRAAGSGGSEEPGREPPSGTPVEQPAAAALALRRETWERLGGMDPRFHPAWFEDVDLGRRLRAAGAPVLYWPAARFRHHLGSTVPRLGYGRFLWIYHRNLTRYLAKHHGAGWAAAARAVLPLGMLLRIVLLPVRTPRRARSRREAVAGLLAVMLGALSGWRLPRKLADASRSVSEDAPSDDAPPGGTP
jgi:GT2 family glycosyltransferase